MEEEGIEDPEDLPPPEVIAEEIAEKLAGATEQFEVLSWSLRARREMAHTNGGELAAALDDAARE